MKRLLQKRNGVDALFYALLVLLGAALLLRCRFGFDWSDETYYTALIYRLARGDRLFSEMWELHQLFAIPLVPLMKLYLWITGGADGVILFFRVCFALTETVSALLLYALLRKRFRPFPSFLAAALSAAFVHFSLCSFSYDSMPPLLLMFSAVLLTAPDEYEKGLCPALSGALYALSVQCYPQLVFALPVYAAFFLLRGRRGGSGKQAVRFLFGVLAVFLLFAAFVLLNSSFSALFDNLPEILSDPTHGNADAVHLLLNYFHTILVILSPWGYVAAAATLFALVYRVKSKGPMAGRLRGAFNVSLLALCVLLTLTVLFYDAESANHNNFFAIPVSVLLPAAFLANGYMRGDARAEQDDALPLLLYALGVSFSVIAHLSSNMGIYASSFPLMLSSVATLLYLSGCVRAEDGHLPRLLLSVAGGLLLCCCVAFRMTGSHREAPVGTLHAKMTTGPAAGILTTQKSADDYAEIVSAIRSGAPADGNILVTSMLPFGYLCSELSPGAQSVWHAPFSERLVRYYALHPDRLPDRIVAVPEGVGMSYGDGDVSKLLAYLSSAYGRTYIKTAYARCDVYDLVDERGNASPKGSENRISIR